ncbi:MAG: DUF3037 domain-containing protein [Saprospiraceae bacterium]|nr:DUF3037 domain-containing protein [Saprospiraceae bacterium]
MQEFRVFEYAVIRIVPRPEREEFVNAGVVLYCSGKKFLGIRAHLPEAKLLALDPNIQLDEIAQHLQAFQDICCGKTPDSPIAQLDPASRFRWLTATRSTMIQTSKVHPGLCKDPEETLEKLMLEMVG